MKKKEERICELVDKPAVLDPQYFVPFYHVLFHSLNSLWRTSGRDGRLVGVVQRWSLRKDLVAAIECRFLAWWASRTAR